MYEGRKPSQSNWYSSKVICGKCGKPYKATNSKTSKTVACSNRTRNGATPQIVKGKQIGCDNRGINEKVLAFFMGYISKHIQTSREEIVSELLNDIKVAQSQDKPIDTTHLEVEIENCNRKKRKAIDMMLDELFQNPTLLSKRHTMTAKSQG